jgi:D-threonate/D-erythronate kinase
MAVTIIADDLTGACDAGALFAGRGPVGVFAAPNLPDARRPAAALDTGTRALSPREAAARVRDAAAGIAARLAGGLLFKKIDSTMRGNVAAELDALMTVTRATIALVCPAFPAQGRAVAHGLLTVHGVPAHESPIGSDPDYPAATSDLVKLLSRRPGRPVSLLPLKEVRCPIEDLARTLAEVNGVVVVDAEFDEDLDAVARAGLRHPGTLLAGSAGLARAAASAWGFAAPAPALPGPGSWLIVAGSRHPATRAQVDALEASGTAGVRLGGEREAELGRVVAALSAGNPAFVSSNADFEGARDDVVARLAGAARAVLADVSPALLVLTGGETAQAVMRALGARHLEIDGAPSNGLALGRLVVDGAANLPVLTKAGGFGPPGLFMALARGRG